MFLNILIFLSNISQGDVLQIVVKISFEALKCTKRNNIHKVKMKSNN